MKKVIVLICLVLSLSACSSQKQVSNSITLFIEIVDETKGDANVLFSEQVNVENVVTLSDAIRQVESIQLEYIETKDGLIIEGFLGTRGDWEKGPWWFISSSNNEGCVKMGYCLGANDVIVSDNDEFTFTLTSEFE